MRNKMNIHDIEIAWSTDCQIDLNDLSQSQVHAAKLHHFYNVPLNQSRIRLAELDNAKNKMILLKRDYYLGDIAHETLKQYQWKPFQKIIIRADLPAYIQADPDIIEINMEIAQVTQIINFLESIIRSINNRGFQIKNILDDLKFKNGIN